ncbi:radical SAM protein [bacterium]|nr:radical SAM protein [bacterium]
MSNVRNRRVLFVNVAAPYPGPVASFPLAGLLLHAHAREAGLIDAAAYFDQYVERKSVDAVADRVVGGDFGVVVLTAKTSAAQNVGKIAQEIKRRAPHVVTMFGGPHPSALPYDALENPAVDYGAYGEGELTFTSMLRAIQNGEDPAGLPGVVYRQDGTVVAGPAPLVEEDPDNLPLPAWETIDPRPYWRTFGMSAVGKRPYFTIFTSRACPYPCTYCHKIFGKKFRGRSSDSVVREMKWLRDLHGVSEFEIVDDIFNIKEDRAIEILDRIHAEIPDATLHFPNGLRTDIMSERYIDAMKRAGTVLVGFAFESASPRLQKTMRKRLDLEAARANLAKCSARGIFCLGFFMLGFPGETAEDMEHTVNFAVKSRLGGAFFYRVKPFKGTEMYEQLSAPQKAMLDSNPDWMFYDSQFGNVSDASIEDILRVHRRAYLRFYVSPTRILRILRTHPRPFRMVGATIREIARKVISFRFTGRIGASAPVPLRPTEDVG